MKITKKLLNSTENRNLEVCSFFYTEKELEELAQHESTFFIDENSLRVALVDVKEIDVELVNDFFVNVAILKDGTKIFVAI